MNDQQNWFPQYAPRPDEPTTLYPLTEAAEHRPERDKFRPYFAASLAIAIVVAFVGVFIVSFDQVAAKAGAADRTAVPSAQPGPPVPQPTGTPATKPTEKSPPVAEVIAGDGTWFVGKEIKSGTYESVTGSTCYWARLSDLSGEAESVIAFGFGKTGRQRVTIAPGDRAFESRDCGEWVMVK